MIVAADFSIILATTYKTARCPEDQNMSSYCRGNFKSRITWNASDEMNIKSLCAIAPTEMKIRFKCAAERAVILLEILSVNVSRQFNFKFMGILFISLKTGRGAIRAGNFVCKEERVEMVKGDETCRFM
jgi:hypothetical protein